MTSSAFIQLAIQSRPDLPPKNVLEQVDFLHNGKEGWNESDDAHADFREEVVDDLYEIDHTQDRALIRYLLTAELEYAREETMMREPLRQLTFMLYRLGHLEDIPLLMEAKTDSCFDAQIALNAELVYGKNTEETKAYFKANPDPEYDIVAYIEEREHHEHFSSEEFIAEMNEYYQH